MNMRNIGLDAEKINDLIADRSNVFYWQTDRAIEPEDAGHIWADRHRYFTDDELVRRVGELLQDDPLLSIEPLVPSAQTNLGNVNSVRIGKLASGKEVAIRCHPKGITNGYFHAEAAAAHLAKQAGMPSYETIAIHDYTGGDDFAFHVLEKLPGLAIARWLEAHPKDEAALLPEIGKMMARSHTIAVTGFGPFDNEAAKSGNLVGLHQTFGDAVRASLSSNLTVLQTFDIFTSKQVETISRLFEEPTPLLDTPTAVLVHNDFADWNLLTDGQHVTGILDWDECVGGDPISDVACWSTFFQPERLAGFLDGYFSIAEKSPIFQDKFELLRLRYVVSKMTLRLRRYSWDPSASIRERIEAGKLHLAHSMAYFNVPTD